MNLKKKTQNSKTSFLVEEQKSKYYFGKNNYIMLKSPKLLFDKNIFSYTKPLNSWKI